MKLLQMIADIGPHQWEQMAIKMPGRTGKQCRERWHNQLNPLLKKARWSIEEDWILYILNETVKNRWAEITNVLLGRSDNSIKNYWNSTLCSKQKALEKDLQSYLKKATKDEQPENLATKRQQFLNDILQFYIRQSQEQYFEHINEKIHALKTDPVAESEQKITSFKIRLMEEALLYHEDIRAQDASKSGGMQSF